MRKILQVLAAIVALATTQALAQTPEPHSSPSAPAVTLTAEQFAALVAKTSAGPTVAPAPTQPAAGVVTADGIFGLSWGTISGGVGSLLLFLYGLWKWSEKARVKGAVEDAIAAVWWVIERNFKDLDGPAKANLALAELHKALAGQGIPLDPKAGKLADLRWAQMSAQDGLQRDRASAPTVAPPAPKVVAQAEAAADVSKQVAGGATAADLLKQAGG